MKTILAVVLVSLLVGCTKKGAATSGNSAPSQLPTTNGGWEIPPLPPRNRATASDIIEAANSGVVPEWFNDAERKAVERMR
jgi:hypothetical protein